MTVLAATKPAPAGDPERAAIGAMLADPLAARVASEVLNPGDFLSARLGRVFGLAVKLYRQSGAVDPLALEAAQSGPDFAAAPERAEDLLESCPTPANVERYCRLVREAARRRKLAALGHRLAQASEGHDDAAAFDALAELEPLRVPADQLPRTISAQHLASFDTARDPDTLLGRRWLCRGGGALLVAETGRGKSTFAMQAAITWALGRSIAGIAPATPLKTLVVQAENDVGDLAEMFQGITRGLKLDQEYAALEERLTLVPENSLTGDALLRALESMLAAYRPDLLILDPLLAYLGDDVNSQPALSRFLRSGLNPILAPARCAALIVHHTPKPLRDAKAKDAWSDLDFAYSGAGSAELANWPRAVLRLKSTDEERVFVLLAPKRGERAGMPDRHEGRCPCAYLRQSEHSIYWEPTVAPPHPEEEQILEAVGAVKDAGGVRAKQGWEICERVWGLKESQAKRKWALVRARLRLVGDMWAVRSVGGPEEMEP